MTVICSWDLSKFSISLLLFWSICVRVGPSVRMTDPAASICVWYYASNLCRSAVLRVLYSPSSSFKHNGTRDRPPLPARRPVPQVKWPTMPLHTSPGFRV